MSFMDHLAPEARRKLENVAEQVVVARLVARMDGAHTRLTLCTLSPQELRNLLTLARALCVRCYSLALYGRCAPAART